mmetsp:Transcript_5682/g.15632  ORF Transcript_5682/g.15632 Transcript_5682/m.15632 type:complete len:431 (-) Transcript_5682:141-1433(-)
MARDPRQRCIWKEQQADKVRSTYRSEVENVASALNGMASSGALPVSTVKHGFIHFHNPVAVVAFEQKKVLSRSISWPILPDAEALQQNFFHRDNPVSAACLPTVKRTHAVAQGESGAVDTSAMDALSIRTPSTACSSPCPRSPTVASIVKAASESREIAGEGDAAAAAAAAAAADALTFALRTPSTTRSSPLSRTPTPHMATRTVALEEAVNGSHISLGRNGRRVPVMPFASLQLPAWAVELAANAPCPTDFGECSSWYSQSPCPTPASSSPASTPRHAATFAAEASAKAKVCWADLADDDDGFSDGWPLLQDTFAMRWLPECDLADASTASPGSTPPASPSFTSRASLPLENLAAPVRAQKDQLPRGSKVCWADLVEEDGRCSDIWLDYESADVMKSPGTDGFKFEKGDDDTSSTEFISEHGRTWSDDF